MISIISLLANIVVLPFIPLIMLLSFVALIASYLFWPLQMLFAMGATVLIEFNLLAVHLLAKVPFATVEMHDVPMLIWIVYYLLCLVFFINPNRSKA